MRFAGLGSALRRLAPTPPPPPSRPPTYPAARASAFSRRTTRRSSPAPAKSFWPGSAPWPSATRVPWTRAPTQSPPRRRLIRWFRPPRCPNPPVLVRPGACGPSGPIGRCGGRAAMAHVSPRPRSPRQGCRKSGRNPPPWKPSPPTVMSPKTSPQYVTRLRLREDDPRLGRAVRLSRGPARDLVVFAVGWPGRPPRCWATDRTGGRHRPQRRTARPASKPPPPARHSRAGPTLAHRFSSGV